jgi:hypothetical protein
MKPYQLGAAGLSVMLSVTVMLAMAAPMCFLQKTNKKFISPRSVVDRDPVGSGNILARFDPDQGKSYQIRDRNRPI